MLKKLELPTVLLVKFSNPHIRAVMFTESEENGKGEGAGKRREGEEKKKREEKDGKERDVKRKGT